MFVLNRATTKKLYEKTKRFPLIKANASRHMQQLQESLNI